MRRWHQQLTVGVHLLLLLLLLLLPLLTVPPVGAHQRSPESKATAPPSQATPQETVSPAHKYFTDVVLVNQKGERVRLYSDLLKGKVVVIGSFFTTCEGSCPVIIGTFAKLQDWLGDRLAKDVHLLSLTVDPETDTPQKVRAYAEKLHAKPGWHFLTGPKKDVDFALYKLGQYVEAKERHRNIIVIGNESTGLWKKAHGVAKPQALIEIIESVLHDQG